MPALPPSLMQRSNRRSLCGNERSASLPPAEQLSARSTRETRATRLGSLAHASKRFAVSRTHSE
eukprot:6172651-Pleurochrysis_carterae.AAC.3